MDTESKSWGEAPKTAQEKEKKRALQNWPFLFLGLGVWSTEFEWAHRLNLRIKRAALRVWRWWSNLLAGWRYRRARDKPHAWVQGPRHMRATDPSTRQ